MFPSAGFYDGKIAPSKEEPTPPPPVAHPSRESGIFSLLRAGRKKEALKPTSIKATAKEAAPKKASAKDQRQVKREEGGHEKHQEGRPAFESARWVGRTRAPIPLAARSPPHRPAIEGEEGWGKGQGSGLAHRDGGAKEEAPPCSPRRRRRPR